MNDVFAVPKLPVAECPREGVTVLVPVERRIRRVELNGVRRRIRNEEREVHQRWCTVTRRRRYIERLRGRRRRTEWVRRNYISRISTR